jgi:hypothetical protein
VDQLVKVQNQEIDQVEAILAYEKEMKARCEPAVFKSRQAALDGHCWPEINDESPLIGARFPPEKA